MLHLEKILRDILYKIEYLEFRQNLLILKEPCHKISILFELDLYTYINMKTFSYEFCEKLKEGQNLTIQDYEKTLSDIWPSVSTYPSAYILIAKCLLPKEILNKITNYQ